MSTRVATVGIGVGTFAVTGVVAVWIALCEQHAQPSPVEAGRVQELPAWFGDAARPNARIAGTVIGAKSKMTVHLLLDIPDPGLWKGHDVRTTATGEFDFGPLRAGPYMVFAEGGRAFSRLVHVDTLRGSGDHVELFAYEQATVMHSIPRDHGFFFDSDWELPYRFVNGDGIPEWQPFGLPMLGTVLRNDGSPASGVGVQPIECAFGDHDVPHGLPTISTTSSSGSFASFAASNVCGVRVWMGPKFHESKIERFSAAKIIRLPEAGAEQHGVFDWRSRDVDDPHGAWLRGRVIRNGQGVPDVDLTAFVMPKHNMEVEDTARTRADGSFELFVSSRDLDKSHDVLLSARQPVQQLLGRQVVRISPGETRMGLTIEVGAGVVVSGVVVDTQGVPVPEVRVECVPWRKDTPATGIDGTFRLTIPAQGRCRLHALVGTGTESELTPLTGLAPKIDVTRPDGEVASIRFVVQRDEVRYVANRAWPGYVDLGVHLQHELVQAVGDELEAAELRAGDMIVAATEGMMPLKDYALFQAGNPPWGENVTITMKRNGKIISVRAKAPTFGVQ
jgi:hypothetical protein